MTTFVLYHAHCPDGFGGAWAAWRSLGDAAEYVPVTHSDPVPALPDGASVVLVDFAYPRDVILAMRERAGELVVLDHHKTAEEDLAGLPFAIFDMSRSGATLAWEYWHPGQPVPTLLRYVEDQDLWRFALPNSREVSAALGSYPQEFAVWDRLDVDELAREGAAILRFRDMTVWSICDRARLGVVGGYTVPIVNATSFSSDVGECLLTRFPDAPFSASYFDDGDGRRRWSLRSRGSFDVGALATNLGGGGHSTAAGFAEPRSQEPGVRS